MSLCDRCFEPGACCKNIIISKKDDSFVAWLDEPIEPQLTDYMGKHPFAFHSTHGQIKFSDEGRPYAYVRVQCTMLLSNGRCGIYKDRPQLCKDYEAGSDPICVHFKGAEAGADDVTVPTY